MIEYKTTVRKGNGCIVRIHRPILAEEERDKREKELKSALNRFGIERMSGR
jgi:hypothetical protein